MLLVYSKYTGKFPVDRFMFTMCVSVSCMIVLLFIAIVHRVKHDQEILDSKFADDEEYLDAMFGLDIEDSVEILQEVNQYSRLNASEMIRLTKRMEERRQTAKDACDRLGIDREGLPDGWEFLINEHHHLIWCNVFKAASSTWMYNFNILGGYSHNQAARSNQPQWLARKIYPRPDAETLLRAHSEPGSVAFIIVRHPFERLSSAYRDKMLSGQPWGMYADLAEEIIMTHRDKETLKSEESFLHKLSPSFEEFVSFILTEAQTNRTLDIHWAPYTPFCTPCQFDFDVIVKFETFEEDENFLVQSAGLSTILNPHQRNVGSEKKANKGKNTTELIKDHFSQLTVEQISQLHQLYKNDFEIFDYSIEGYYEMGKAVLPKEQETSQEMEDSVE